MKHTIIITVVAGAVAGFLAGSLSRLFSPPTPAPVATDALAPAPAGLTDAHGASMESVDELRSQLTELTMRLALLEAGAAQGRERADGPSGEALAEVTEDRALSELADALGTPGRQLPDSLKLGVEQVVQEVRDAERRERDARRAESLTEITETRLAELVTALNLTPVQTDAMRDHMNTYAEKRATLMETARESGDFLSVRTTMRTLRDESREGLALILDPTQLELYRETEDDGRGRGRDERRGGRGGGSGR